MKRQNNSSHVYTTRLVTNHYNGLFCICVSDEEKICCNIDC